MGDAAVEERAYLMARVARRKEVVIGTGGLYGAIARAVEESFAGWDALPKPRHYLTGELLPHPYPYQHALDAVRAGVAVNVAVCDLPTGVQQSIPRIRMGFGSDGRRVPCRPARALVSPDDSMAFPDNEEFLRWLEEDGFFNDFGPQAKRLEIAQTRLTKAVGGGR